MTVEVAIGRTGDADPACGRCLAPDEQERAARFRFAGDAARWVAARAFVRRTLGEALDVPPESLVFNVSETGKPALAEPCRGIRCNWSHAGDLVAVAWAQSVEVGIDLEVVRWDFPAMEVAGHFFTPAERSALERATGKARQRLFFQLWTAKEALMKAVGLGVGLPPEEIDCEMESDGPVGYRSHPTWRLDRRSYAEAELELAVATPMEAAVTVHWPGFQELPLSEGDRASVRVG